MSKISPISEIIEDIKCGKMVILVDDEDRENEGDLVIASDFVTPEAINFMAKYGRGLVCLTLTPKRCELLNLDLMVKKQKNGTQYGTNFTVSIEAREGVSTGISAHDRALTIQAATAENATADDIVQPGHIFPLKAQNGGVLIRAGHTEAGCDLAQLAGLAPYSVICEIMNDDGSMARLPDLLGFAAFHQLKIGTIADLIQYRLQNESMIELQNQKQIQSNFGDWQISVFTDKVTQQTHIALQKGVPDASKTQPTIVRVHEPTSIFDALLTKTQHSWALPKVMAYCEQQYQQQQQASVIVLLNCAQDTTGLLEHFADIDLNPNERTPKNYDLRVYGIGAQILKNLGVTKMQLLSKPIKMPSMLAYGLEVESHIAAAPADII